MIFGSGPRTTRARSSPLIGQFPGAWLIIVIEIKHLAPLNAINYIGRWHNEASCKRQGVICAACALGSYVEGPSLADAGGGYPPIA